MFRKLKELLAKKELDEDKKDVEFEKGDFLALAIAAGSVFIPVVILIFAAIALLIWILF